MHQFKSQLLKVSLVHSISLRVPKYKKLLLIWRENSEFTFSYGSSPFNGNFNVAGSRFHTFDDPDCPTTGTRRECPDIVTICANGLKLLINVVNSLPNAYNGRVDACEIK